MQKDPKVFIDYILASINAVQSYTSAMTKDEFMNNKLVQDAVIRNIEVIGEATKSIGLLFRQQHAHIPWKNMAGMRDILIHEYMRVDLEAVWNTITKDLPGLKINLENLPSG